MIRKAFTLIELLIVIVIIGILATAVLSAINPVEQIRKSQDTAKRADAAQLTNALERYFATTQNYPWLAGIGSCVAASAPTAAGVAITGSECWLTNLVTNNELKSEFIARANLTSMYIALDANNLVHVCFVPASTSFNNQANSNRLQTGVGTTGTYLCIPE